MGIYASATTAEELFACNNPDTTIALERSFALDRPLTLRAGVAIDGGGHTLSFPETDGVALVRDNAVRDLRIECDAKARAVLFADDPEGTFLLERVTTKGQIALINERGTHDVFVDAHDVCVEYADATARAAMPHGYNVDVEQGAFTLWNRAESTLYRAKATGISVGTSLQPVIGSGVFVSGDESAEFLMTDLQTSDVFADSAIPSGVPSKVSGGVFVVHRAHVGTVSCTGVVQTWGNNAMALDNWGSVDTWTATKDVSTFGPSSIGFVNFGRIGMLALLGDIVTRGLGSRGFNNYDGTVERLLIGRIETFGDGAVGFQISKPVGTVSIARGITTHGGTGMSLVKGAMKELQAHAFSIIEGGSAAQASIGGPIRVDDPETQAVVGAEHVEGGLKTV